MPKSRKKKVKHQDFAKVKLKVGKKLPRAANETTTGFKSQAIQIKEQFKGGTASGGPNQPSTKRKQVIGDLLGQCQHYSNTVRHDALAGLRELLASNPVLVHQHLNSIVERCAELFVDKDSVVRTNVQRLLKNILPSVSVTKISPFFPVLSAHLCCAMTHIYEDIQADSLTVLDLLLENYPSLVIASSSKLLPNFLDQISRQTGTGTSGGKDKERTLVVNPSGKLGSHKWRVRVLDRLYRLLQAAVNIQTHNDQSDTVPGGVRSVRWKDGRGFIPIAPHTDRSNGLTLRRQNGTSQHGQGDILSDSLSLKHYMDSLISLLFQCWVEVGPAQLASSLPDNALDTDALSTLASVLQVLDLLLRYTNSYVDHDTTPAKSSWLCDRYQKDIVHYFMHHFPYVMHEQQTKKKKSNREKHDTPTISIQSLNLSVCDVMTYFMEPTQPDVMNETWFDTVGQYIIQQMREAKQSTEQLKIALNVLNQMLKMPLEEDLRDDILDAVYYVYRQKHPKSSELYHLVQFFARIFFQEKMSFRNSRVYLKWIQTLPWLLQELSNYPGVTLTVVLEVMKTASIQREEKYLKKVQDSLSNLLDVKFVSKLPENQQRTLVEILYNIPRWTRQDLTMLSCLLAHDGLGIDMQIYVLNILGQRMLRSHDMVSMDIADYLSFMFTVITGLTKDKLDSLSCLCANHDRNTSSNNNKYTIVWEEKMGQSWYSHCRRLQISTYQLCMLPVDDMVSLGAVWSNFVSNILKACRMIPLPSAVSLLYTTACLPSTSHSLQVSTEWKALIGSLLLDTMASIDVSVGTNHTQELSTDVNKFTTQSCIKCVRSVAGLWPCVVIECKERIQSGGVEDVLVLLASLQVLMSADELKQSLLENTVDIKQLLSLALELYPSIESSQQYSGLKYLASLLP